MNTHNISFYGEIKKIILYLSSNTHFICFSAFYRPVFREVYYTPGIYAEGYIVFIFLFVRTYVRSFVRSFVLPSRSWNYFKVLRASNSSGVYLTNHSSKSIHIWTLKGWLSFHDSSPHGLCPGVGLEVKI